MSTDALYCTFELDDQLYGVSVDDAREVIMNQPRTPVPLAPPAVLGIMNIRGRVISAIDMRTVLRLPEMARPAESVHLIVRHQDEEVGLVVDRIGDVLTLNPQQRQSAPETLGAQERAFMDGVFQLEDTLMLELDIHKVLEDELCTRARPAEASQHGCSTIHKT